MLLALDSGMLPPLKPLVCPPSSVPGVPSGPQSLAILQAARPGVNYVAVDLQLEQMLTARLTAAGGS